MLQTTPLDCIVEPPSRLIVPPLVAVVIVISATAAVVSIGKLLVVALASLE